MTIKGVIFDMDGTIVDTAYDWPKIRSDLNTEGKPILVYLKELAEPERSEKWAILEKYEQKATAKATLKAGVKELLSFLSSRGIKKALVTNNSEKNVSFLLQKFQLNFECVISRESGLWKPYADPFLKVMQVLHLKKEECCVVGDSHFDILAAQASGIQKIFIINSSPEKFSDFDAMIFSSIPELQRHLADII